APAPRRPIPPWPRGRPRARRSAAGGRAPQASQAVTGEPRTRRRGSDERVVSGRYVAARSDRANAVIGFLVTAELGMTEAVHHVIVHHAGRLHVGVADRGADEREATLLQVLAHRVGLRGARGDQLHRLPRVAPGRAVDEAPDVLVEALELLLHFEESARV